MAIATKKLLADGLKDLLRKKTLEKITVKELVAQCGVNRQTFYYNFQDIYELLEWMFRQEGERLQKETEGIDNWRDRLDVVLRELEEDDSRRLVINAFYSVDSMWADKFLQNYFTPLVENVIDNDTKDISLSKENRDFIIRMYVLFCIDLIVRWIKSGMEREDMEDDIEKILEVMSGSSQYVAKTLNGLDERKKIRNNKK